jgi:hypothetical protein
MRKFVIQTLVKFSYKFWRNLSQTELIHFELEPERARRATSRHDALCRPHRRTGTHARWGARKPTGPRPGTMGIVRRRVVTGASFLRRCHAASTHSSALAHAPRHWPESRRMSPPPPRAMLRPHESTWTRTALPRLAPTIKNSPFVPPTWAISPLRHRRPPLLPPPVNSRLHSRPWSTYGSELLHSLHLSSTPTHGLADPHISAQSYWVNLLLWITLYLFLFCLNYFCSKK